MANILITLNEFWIGLGMKNIIKRFNSTFDYAVTENLVKKKIKPSQIAQLRFKQLVKKMPEL